MLQKNKIESITYPEFPSASNKITKSSFTRETPDMASSDFAESDVYCSPTLPLIYGKIILPNSEAFMKKNVSRSNLMKNKFRLN